MNGFFTGIQRVLQPSGAPGIFQCISGLGDISICQLLMLDMARWPAL